MFKFEMGRWTPSILCCAIGLTAGLATFTPTQQAEACGGFFCNQNTGVVNQSAEQIIFSDNPDGTVTAVIQILYQGPADEFSWVLPVPGVPDVEVSSNTAFARLQAATNPTYQLNRIIEGECADSGGRNAPSAGNDFDSADPSPDAEPAPEDGGVTVVGGGSVGPYDYEVIAVDQTLPDAAQIAVEWLTDNGYDVTDIGPDLLRPYLEDGLNLIAFRLQKTAEAGSVRPVVLTYETEHPMIPIKLTAVAAADNMGVMTFVLGDSRAIPTNYRALELNEAVINWFNPTTNYTQVVNLAADESGGQGFVTEFAGLSEPFANTIFGESDIATWDNLAETDWSGREGDLLANAASFYAAWDGFREAVAAKVPLPENVTLEEFTQCVFCYDLVSQREIEGFEPNEFIAALEENVIEPMRATQEIIDGQPYMTRMFTTLSAPEMILDPGFLFNPLLGDVDNVHIADQIIECSPEVNQFDAPWRVALPQGGTVRGQGQVWPFDTEGDMPANREIRQLDTDSEGMVVSDNRMIIGQELERSNANFPSPSASNSGELEGSCACQSPTRPARTPSALGFLVLALIGGLIARRS